MTVIIFIIILAVLVLVHEFGHFIVAKASGIRVDEFGLGFPPRMYGYKRGETTYSINWIPFGGFVKIFGENGDLEDEKYDPETGTPSDASRSFVNKSRWIQAAVLVAGICFNVIFAWLLLSGGFMVGMPVPQDYDLSNAPVQNLAVTITSVDKGSPADKAGLKTGDAILGLSSGSTTLQDDSIDGIQNFIAAHGTAPIIMSYREGSTLGQATIIPQAGILAGRPAIGVALDVLGTLKLGPVSALWQGAKLTYAIVEETVIGLGQFLFQTVTGKASLSEVTGPVGIAGLVGDAARLGFVYLVTFTAFISINLAVINLIPFPALDGGRLLFVLIEKIKGSAINPSITNWLNNIGFALIILLMIVVTYHDILQLIR